MAGLLVGIPLSAQGAVEQGDWFLALIREQSYSQAGKLLAERGALSGKELRFLWNLDPPAFEAIYQSFLKASVSSKKTGVGRLRTLLRGVHFKAEQDLFASLQTLSPLLEYRPWMVSLTGILGSMAIQLSRRGNPAGLPILRKIATIWKGRAFASANLALALRLIGKYTEADHFYRKAAKESGRAAWVLNNWGLCRDAMKDLDGALALFLEGARGGDVRKKETNPGDLATCQTNAALLLAKRGFAGDRVRAIDLLRRATTLAPDRIRPRYYLHIFLLESSGRRQ